MYSILKAFLFMLPPEKAHYFAMDSLKFILKLPGFNLFFKAVANKNPVTIAGLTFPNKVGIAAGFDKNAMYVNELEALGFGFVEIGTVTPLPQDGNPQPRLFRLPQDNALINRMGFNNHGATVVAERLSKLKKGNIILGGNLGKNKVTPNENAADDYEIAFEKLYPYVDYFVVNVSSPNTPGLRALQDKDSLIAIFERLYSKANELRKDGANKPIFLKIAPDLENAQLDDIISLVMEKDIEGIIATNTTISREGLHTSGERIKEIGNGGLSGKPVKERSTEVIAYLRKAIPSLPIIGVGGIHSLQDAQEKVAAGANLVQIYTGFIYEGKSLVKKIAKNL